jgi:iron complex outermembrane recepter protein
MKHQFVHFQQNVQLQVSAKPAWSKHSTHTPKRLSTAITGALVALLFVPQAQGQNQGPEPEQSANDAPEILEDVVVTGSRVKRADAETAQPVLVLSRADIEKSGLTSIGDVLQRITEAGPSINTQFNNGGNGTTTVSLRNLGANRTLVLFNGHRWVTSTNGSVDLNTIPTGIIESIEVLKDGASTVYGSDAIAGVVNIITRRGFQGAVANGFYGQNSEGDGTRYSSDFTFGISSDRGSASISAGYVKEEEISAGDREISAVPNFGLDPAATGSSTTPAGRYFVNGRPGSFTNIGPQAGPSNVAGQYRPFNAATDLYNFAPDNFLLTPQERASIFAEGRYTLSDGVEFNAHMLYNNRRSDILLAAIPVVLGNRTTGVAGGITVAANNPYNTLGGTIVGLQRRFVETGGRRSELDNSTFRFGGGFNGAFDFADRSFDWDMGYSYATVKETTLGTGNLNLNRVRNALTAFDADPGVGFMPTCGTAGPNAARPLEGASLIQGCVPLNILAGNGGLTPEMLNYITFTGVDKQQTESTNLFASVTGTVLELPAGSLGFAAGYEYRKENGSDIPDAITAAGDTTGNSRLATGGGYSLKEVFAEFVIPLLQDQPFAELLEARLAGRYSDYSNFGNTTNFSAGFQWKPISDLKIRGNYNQGFRAPDILNLFRGVTDNFPQLSDPCLTGQFANRGSQNAATIGRCNNGFAGVAAVPLTNGIAPTQDNAQIRTQIGGEATLTPETSKGYSFGFVYSPEYLTGFDIGVDYWNIRLENNIGGRSAALLLTQCYVNANASACGRISRNAATGQITNILATSENVGYQDISGVDVGFGYKLPEMTFGRIGARVDSTYFIKDISQNLAYDDTQPFQYFVNNPINTLVGNYAGRGGTTNRLKANMALDWTLGAWSANWTARYTSRFVEGCRAIYVSLAPQLCTAPNALAQDGSSLPLNRVGGVTYHDISVAYASDWDSTVRVGVKNAFDRRPPNQTNTFANSFDPAYDVPGSFWFMSYNQRF